MVKKRHGAIPSGILLIQAALVLTFLGSSVHAQQVSVWVTSGDKSKLLQKQTIASFGSSNNATKITLNENTTYQTIDGAGHCMTEGSAQVIYGLAAQQQDSLLNLLFNLNTGIGMPVIRVSIGASDLGNGVYSYDDVAGGDTAMAKFSFKGVDSTYLIPILKKVVAINPKIKILACPWSPPAWMKTNNSFVNGNLATQNYAAYAKYFVKYIQGMQANGIPIYAVTVQNEPENCCNNPSCVWTSAQETNFINNNLGPAFKAAGITTKIIAYDHNCDDTNFPTFVCNNSTYVDGSAFHLYAGDISAMSTVYNTTHKNVYMTEQCTCGDDFSNDMSYHMPGVILSSFLNYGKMALEWNLATDPNYGPHTDNGGCGICDGGITVNNPTSFSLNPSFYIVAQATKVIKTNSTRIATASTSGNMTNVACINPDGTRGLVVYNKGSSTTFDVVWNGQAFPFTLGSNAVASFLWQGAVKADDRKTAAKFAFANIQNYPEPFKESTRINFTLTKTANADVFVYNSKGTVVASLMHGSQSKGNQSITWNGRDVNGCGVSAGVYVVKLTAEGYSIAKRILKQ